MAFESAEDIEALLAGSNRKVDLLGVIQKHIASSMEADREAQVQFKAKLDELKRTKEINAQLQRELNNVRVWHSLVSSSPNLFVVVCL